MHLVRAANRVRTGLGQADVQNLALGAPGRPCAPTVSSIGVFGIDPVLVIEIDVIGVQTLQGALDCGTDVGRSAVGDAGPASGMRHQSELGGDDHLIPLVRL